MDLIKINKKLLNPTYLSSYKIPFQHHLQIINHTGPLNEEHRQRLGFYMQWKIQIINPGSEKLSRNLQELL